MSLTNPNKPVTEARLQEFYHRIKNFLGFTEMPSEDMNEIVTPKPSVRARYQKYSTEEQVVGEWVNGKPIYQKTIVGTTLSSGVSGIQHGISNLEDVVEIHGVAHGSSNGTQYIFNFNGGVALDATSYDMLKKFSLAIQSVMSNQIVIFVGAERYASITSYNFTICYTKTTD